MPSYAFGVDGEAVKQEEIDYFSVFDSDLMEQAIQRAAGKLNNALRFMRIDPESITEATYPDDWQWCRSVIISGAAGYYISLTTSAWTQANERLQRMRDDIKEFKLMPTMLQAYNPTAASTATARSGATHETIQATTDARRRMLDPANPRRWRQ